MRDIAVIYNIPRQDIEEPQSFKNGNSALPAPISG